MKLRIFLLGLLFCALTVNVQAMEELPDPITNDDYYPVPTSAKVALGKALFYDKILSGNQNIACATCHHPAASTGDDLSLPIGEGGAGLATSRSTGSGSDAVHERVPRNSPHVFNLGAKEFTTIFHDGRVTIDASQPSGFSSPAGAQLPAGLDNPLAVQAMFPVTSGTEMAGQAGENAIADAAASNVLAGVSGVWGLLAQRLRDIPEYVAMFQAAFPGQINVAEDIQFKDAANAIAAFEATAWRADNSRFDQYLRGDKDALSQEEEKGMKLFYGKANCSSCHSGKFQTDQSFHAIAMPQIGPGKGDNSAGYSDGHEDFGREQVTGDASDRFKFRTPSLRNIALTAPYGHAGAYATLEAIVEHHFNPVDSLLNYDAIQTVLPSRADLDAQDTVVMDDPGRVDEIAIRNALTDVDVKDKDLDDLISFLHTLTDESNQDNTVPSSVPSGLPVAD